MKTFDKGDLIRATAKFYRSGALTDPDTVTFKVMSPAGATTTYSVVGSEIVKSSTGIYYRDLNLTQEGTYKVRIESTGTDQGAQEDKFFVRDTDFS